MPAALGAHREHRGLGEPRRRAALQHVRGAVLGNHHVDAAHVAAAQRGVDLRRDLAGAPEHVVGQPRGHEVLGLARRVHRLVVVESLLGDDLDGRQRFGAVRAVEDGDRDLGAVDPPLHEDLPVVAKRREHRLGKPGGVGDSREARARSPARRA